MVTAPDQLRQRVAFALSEIFVVSDVASSLAQQPEALANYYDTLANDAFGNFRQLLQDATLSPVMGNYLNMLRNAAAIPSKGTSADENYAREIMQLFTIGLNMLNPDGTLQLDTSGQPIPTYNNTTIVQTANVFTGWSYHSTLATPSFTGGAADWYNPMQLYTTFHDNTAKTIVSTTATGAPVVIPANQGGAADLKMELDALFNHQNTGPFFCRQLIQRLVTSNPSPGYVYRVAQVFANDGTGTRGNLAAVVKAILLDYEARSSAVVNDASFGKLKEPHQRQTALYRAFNANSQEGRFAIFSADQTLGQAALRSPTVFNFFLPAFVPPGMLAAAGLDGPEFQITTASTAIVVPNAALQLDLHRDHAGADNTRPRPVLAHLGPGQSDPGQHLEPPLLRRQHDDRRVATHRRRPRCTAHHRQAPRSRPGRPRIGRQYPSRSRPAVAAGLSPPPLNLSFPMLTPQDLTRRKFIGTACSAVGATGLLSALAQLRMIGAVAGDAAAAAGSSSGYKALVCVFLYGGSDANNVIVPIDTAGYNTYATQRTALALPQANLLPFTTRTYNDGHQYGLHPSLVEVQSLFGQGKLALLANTGVLTYPTTLQQYNSGTASLPPQLFSHADQQTQWQSSIPDQPFQTGWGGRLADIINALNGNSSISMSVSVAGENSFQIGNVVSQYAVSPSGAVTLSNTTGGTINPVRYSAQLDLLNQTDQNLFQAAFANTSGSAISDANLLTSVLTGAATLQTKFPNTSLGTQLEHDRENDFRGSVARHAAPDLFRQPRRLRHPHGRIEHPGTPARPGQPGPERVLQRHGRTRRVRPGHDLHRVGFQPHLQYQWQRRRPRLGQPPHGPGRRGRRRGPVRQDAFPDPRRPGRHRPRSVDSFDQRGPVRRHPRHLVRRQRGQPARRAAQYRTLCLFQFGVHEQQLSPDEKPARSFCDRRRRPPDCCLVAPLRASPRPRPALDRAHAAPGLRTWRRRRRAPRWAP